MCGPWPGHKKQSKFSNPCFLAKGFCAEHTFELVQGPGLEHMKVHVSHALFWLPILHRICRWTLTSTQKTVSFPSLGFDSRVCVRGPGPTWTHESEYGFSMTCFDHWFCTQHALRSVHGHWPGPKKNTESFACFWPLSPQIETGSEGVGIAQWLEHPTHDRRVPGLSPHRSNRIIFFSRVNYLLTLHPFHPCVTTVACKRSQSFCQKCRWQVTAKHTCTAYVCGFK